MSWNDLKHDRRVLWAGYAAIGIVLAVLPFLVGAGLGNAWLRILNFAMLYIMLALGLNIVVGFAGLLDLGYIAFYAVGAYLYALLASPHFGLHWPVWAILPLGAVVAGGAGALLGAPTLRLRGDYLAIVTLGFGEIIRIFMNNLNAPVNITNGPQGISSIDPFHVGGVTLAETMALAKPFIIYSPLPGQEERNTSFLRRHRLAVTAASPEQLPALIKKYLAAPQALALASRALAGHARPHAARDIAAKIIQALTGNDK